MATTGRVAAARTRTPWRTRARVIGDSPPIRYFMQHPDLAAALLFALLVFVYLWPVLIGGKILSPIALLYGAPPWQGYTPTDITDYYNPLLSDIPKADYPWRLFARDAIRGGTIPLWNEGVFAGIPFLSNSQNGIFTPFNLPLWTLPLNYALGLSAAIKLWAGGFGSYLLARQLRLGFLPGMLAGVAFAFCAFNIVWLTHDTPVAVAVLLPWMLLLIERIFERGRLGPMLWLAVATAIGLGGGHPGMQVHLTAICALYAVVRVWLVPDLDRAEQLRRLGLVAGGMLLGILLMAVMLLPEALSSRGTIGTKARESGVSTLPGSTMPFDAIKTTIFPDWWGRQSSQLIAGSETSAGSLVNYNERTFYAGAVALLFALVALVSRGGWRAKAPFLLLAVVGLATPLHMPGLWTFVTHVPPFDLIQNQRIHFAFAFAVAMLAAFGLHELIERPREERRRLAVPVAALALGIVALITIGASGADVSDLADHFLTGVSFARGHVLALTTVTWFLFFTLGVGVALLAAYRWPRLRYAIAAAVLLLAVVDALHFANGYQPMGYADKVIPPTPPSVRFLQAHAGDGRISGMGEMLATDWSTTYGLRDVRGYDPPYPTERMFDLWRVANRQQSDWMTFRMDDLDAPGLQILSVLGAKYIATDPGVVLPRQVKRDPTLRALRPAYAGDDATILSNASAVPRAAIAREVVVSGDASQTRELIASRDFSPRTMVVVEGDEAAAAALAGGPAPRGSVNVTGEKNAEVALDARLDRRGLVVLNDALTAGWTVTVDGEKADPVRVNSVMRGVVVDPGDHKIVWSYAMPGLKVGALVSLLALLAIVGGAIALTVRTKRQQGGT